MLDPLGAVADVIIGLHRTGKLQAFLVGWSKLIFTMTLSALMAYYGTKGWALWHGDPLLIAIGKADFSVACSLLAFFLSSPLTRGMTLIIPKGVVEAFQSKQDDHVKIEHDEGKQ